MTASDPEVDVDPKVDPADLIAGGDIGGALIVLNQSLRGIGRRMDRKFARNLTVMVVLVIAVFVALGIAFSASHNAHTARSSLAAYLTDRDAARIASCNQQNVASGVQVAAEIAQSHDFVAAITAGSTDPAIQPRIDAFNTRHDALIRSEHELRDCSKAGIVKYLSGVSGTQAQGPAGPQSP